jgi:hypothetical protein
VRWNVAEIDLGHGDGGDDLGADGGVRGRRTVLDGNWNGRRSPCGSRLGGGGAEQDPILPGRTHAKVPADYPLDQYWKGAAPKEDYNYVIVEVKPGQKTKFTLNRLRPWSVEPFATMELFGTGK